MDAKEYRVVWKREGCGRRVKIFALLKSAERRVSLMTSDKPWEAFGKKAEEYNCCSGRECGCGGQTVEQTFNQVRSSIPKLIFVEIEERPIGSWSVLQRGGEKG